MDRRGVVGVTLALVALSSCGVGAVPAAPGATGSAVAPPPPLRATPGPGGPGIGPVSTSTPTDVELDPGFPRPDATFSAHFTDPIYHDVGDEFAPFGSDEGFDLLYGWKSRRTELTRCSTVGEVYGSDEADLATGARDPATGPDVDGEIIGAGFTLLLLTGHIDPSGKRAVLDAIRGEARYYHDETIREFPVLLRDLEPFPAIACER